MYFINRIFHDQYNDNGSMSTTMDIIFEREGHPNLYATFASETMRDGRTSLSDKVTARLDGGSEKTFSLSHLDTNGPFLSRDKTAQALFHLTDTVRDNPIDAIRNRGQYTVQKKSGKTSCIELPKRMDLTCIREESCVGWLQDSIVQYRLKLQHGNLRNRVFVTLRGTEKAGWYQRKFIVVEKRGGDKMKFDASHLSVQPFFETKDPQYAKVLEDVDIFLHNNPEISAELRRRTNTEAALSKYDFLKV